VALGCTAERLAWGAVTSAATATSDAATEQVITEGWMVQALVMMCHNETDGRARRLAG
jgi:hypothetical protein